VAVVAGMSDGKLGSKLDPLVASDSVREVRLFRRRPFAYPKTASVVPAWLGRCGMLIAEAGRLLLLVWECLVRRPDLIAGFFLTPHGIYAITLGRLFRIPSAILFLGTDLTHQVMPSRFARAWLWLVRKADFVGTRGPNASAWLAAHGIPRDRLFEPPNHFDFGLIPKPERTEPEYDLIAVGSLVLDKRYDVLFQALASAARRGARARCAIVGDGPLLPEMAALTRGLGLEGQVEFLGHRQDVYTLLGKARAFILTSRGEGLPMAMIEAMACGLPCIVPDVGEISSVARHEHNALLAPALDAEAFAQAIARLLTDEDLRRRLAANAGRIREEKSYEYSLENARRIWEEVLARLPVRAGGGTA
jgi:glycosyltransferase involved in cell wall biosynthesis